MFRVLVGVVIMLVGRKTHNARTRFPIILVVIIVLLGEVIVSVANLSLLLPFFLRAVVTVVLISIGTVTTFFP